MKKLACAILALAMLAGCSSQPTKPAQSEQAKPKTPDLATGRIAFQKMFISARAWSRDAQPYRLSSQPSTDSKGHDGKSAVWRASFASDSRGSMKAFTWSGTDANDAPARGVLPGNEDSYNRNNASTQVFDVSFLKVDSDKAFDVAQKHRGDKVLEKNPDLPVFYVLDWSRPANELIWHIVYGISRDEAKLRVAVNASTGEYLRVEK